MPSQLVECQQKNQSHKLGLRSLVIFHLGIACIVSSPYFRKDVNDIKQLLIGYKKFTREVSGIVIKAKCHLGLNPILALDHVRII